MRALALAVLLAACGGGGKSSKAKDTTPAETPPPAEEDAPIENVAPEEPVEDEAPVGTTMSVGAPECDLLIKRSLCLFDKYPDMPPEAKTAFMDGVQAWAEALRNDATRQATIDACKMSLDGGKAAFDSVAC